jgi:hypothetical protein
MQSELEITDYGDAITETKQSVPGGLYVDNMFGWAWYP